MSPFFVLVITQCGHVVEHVVQMLQIHVLDRTGRTLARIHRLTPWLNPFCARERSGDGALCTHSVCMHGLWLVSVA